MLLTRTNFVYKKRPYYTNSQQHVFLEGSVNDCIKMEMLCRGAPLSSLAKQQHKKG